MNAILSLARFFSTHPLARDAPLKAWARFVSWQIKSRLRQEVLFPWIGGQRLAVRRGMTGATGNVYVGLHEFPDMMVSLHFLREGDLFLDIGANVGSYTVLASGVCRATTFAFEPDPTTVQHLRRNVAINSLDRLVTIYECALGSTDGNVPFTVGLVTTNKVGTGNGEDTRIVLQHRLDTLIGGISRPAMMKIDVEGYEEEVLRGARTVLGNSFVKVIEVETVTGRTEDILLRHCFCRAYYDPFSRKLARKPVGPKSSNSLYVRDWPFVDARLKGARSITIFNYNL
jgi:FkbM family methyltransferase